MNVVDAGESTMTGGRMARVRDYVGDETFMMTYGDGVCDVDLRELLAFRQSRGKIATITAVLPQQQKGVLDIDEHNSVRAFREKQASDAAPANAGYMVLEPAIFDHLNGDACARRIMGA